MTKAQAQKTRILLVEDKQNLRRMLRQSLEAEGYAVEEAANVSQAIGRLESDRFQLILSDLKMPGGSGHDVLKCALEQDPDLPVVMLTAYGTIGDAVAAMKVGAFDFLSKPVDPDHLMLVLDRALGHRRLESENQNLREQIAERLGFGTIVGGSPALKEVMDKVRRVSSTEATVLLTGESGTGKELFARAIHDLSGRKDLPFVALNCAAIPDTLLENELFGHEKGAYTGAGEARAGKVEMAAAGTLFLDEIGDLSSAVQAKVLRVIQERSFERLGGTRTIEVDLRLVAATNRDLQAAVQAKQFREDLFFRLSVFPVAVPPLRERRDDVPLLAQHFLAKSCREMKKAPLRLSEGALAALAAYRWPGNIRELQNCIERAVILCDGDELLPEHLGLLADPDAQVDAAILAAAELPGPLQEAARMAQSWAERARIRATLDTAGGNKSRAAELLRISYKTLLNKIRDLGL
ncbi:MAG: sigma-54 dependent transcriptional regulator [Acidobacteriota bacterium]